MLQWVFNLWSNQGGQNLSLKQKGSLLSRQFQGISCDHHHVLRENLALQSGALNWVWVVENSTLSSSTGIQKEGQRSAFKYICYCHLLFSCDLLFPGGGLKGNWKIPVHWLGSCHGDLIRKFMHKKLKGRSLLAKNKSLKEDLWNRTATFLKVLLVPPFWDEDSNCFKQTATRKFYKTKIP